MSQQPPQFNQPPSYGQSGHYGQPPQPNPQYDPHPGFQPQGTLIESGPIATMLLLIAVGSLLDGVIWTLMSFSGYEYFEYVRWLTFVIGLTLLVIPIIMAAKLPQRGMRITIIAISALCLLLRILNMFQHEIGY